MTRRWLAGSVFAVACLLALAAGFRFGANSTDGDVGDPRGEGSAALLGVALPDVTGRQQSLAQWKGKVLVVNFWATWCTPCREEMPEFVKAQSAYGDRGLQFVGIAIDQPDKVQEFAAELGLNYPTLIGGYGAIELSKTLGNTLGALPFTIVIDRSGRIVHTRLGPFAEPALRSILGQLL